MNRAVGFIFIVILILSFPTFYSSNVSAKEVAPLIGKGPHVGANDIFYSDDLAIEYASYSKGEIDVPVGRQFVSFQGISTTIDWRGALNILPTSPSVVINVKFNPKLLAKGDRFIKLNVTVELSYNLLYQSYLRIKYPDGTFKDLQGSGKTTLVKDFTSITPLGDASLSLELYTLGPLGILMNAFVQINKIYESAQRSFHIASSHMMYFSDDYKTVYHYVDLPVYYSTEGWDEVYTRVLYPKVYELKSVKVNEANYSFEDWTKTVQGNATILTKRTPFGSGSISTTLSMVFTTPQSVYIVQTLTSLLSESESWTYNDTLVLVSVNLDVKITELRSDQYSFIYIILNPAGEIIKSSYFPSNSFKLNQTSKSPLGKVLIANDNVTLDSSFAQPGLYTVQVISKTPYSLGFNKTSFLVYSLSIGEASLGTISNSKITGNFMLSSDLNISEYNRGYKGAYVMLYDNSSPPRLYTKTFNVGNSLGVTSITVKNKVDYPGTLDSPASPNLIFFAITNNSTAGISLDSITIKVHVFDTVSVASVPLLEIEPSYFFKGDIKAYTFVFSLPLLNQYVADQLSKNYNITAKLISQQTGNSYNLRFVYEKDPSQTNPALVQLQRIKVWKLEIVVAGKSYSTDWLLYDPSGRFKGDVIYITEANLESNKVNFEMNYLLGSVLQRYELYAIAYTSDYLSTVSKLMQDEIYLTYAIKSSLFVKGKEGQKITIPIEIRNLSNITTVTFDIEIYNGDILISNATYTLAPKENKTVNIEIEIPKQGSQNYFKIKSSTLKAIMGYIFIQYDNSMPEQFNKLISNNTSYIIILLLIVALISFLILRKTFSKR